jgi:chitin-binding protein
MLRHLFKHLLVLAWALGLAGQAAAHGLMQDPPARNWFCGAVTKPDHAANGTAQYPVCAGAFANDPNGGYQFMSVLTHARGRAAVTPLPAHVCGFGSETWQGGATPWDQPIDWPTTPMSAGRQKITWNISWGPHFDDTEEFRYWITKPGFVFQAGRALTWDDFEAAPFCSLPYSDSAPNANPDVVPDKAATQFHTYCTVPARQGRHVIYGEWGRNQWTLERFHGCLDLQFSGNPNPDPAPVARITMQPVVTEFSGPGSITFSAATSSGSGLSYQWSVNAANPALYTLSNTSTATTQLTMANPGAAGTVMVSLLATNAQGSSSASASFTHRPASQQAEWTDLGALTAQPRTLLAGDTVQVRTVLSNGQDQYFPATPLAITAANAAAAAWPNALAQAVNQAAGSLRVGVLNATSGQVVPVQDATANRMYAASGAGIASAFLQVRNADTGGGVSASYTINNDWTAGYCANITVTNNGTSTVTWNATMVVQGRVSNLWNATWTQTGDTVSFSGPAWGATLAPGASFTQAGFCAVR